MKPLPTRNATLVLLLAAFSPGTAQEPGQAVPSGTGAVMGRVVADDSGEPLAGTGIVVWSVTDSATAARTVSGEEGRFRVGGLAEGTYRLELTNLGYGTVTTEAFELAYDEARDLGTLRLPVEALVLEPIQVSTQRTAVTYEADRTLYNVGVMPGTQGASVEEALRAIPELEIDIDGRITLRGSTPTVYIDGQPAPMTAEMLILFLEQFPADYLARIEVIENPSARYAAEGSGGIVNLVMKEGVELGMSGSVHAQTGTRGQHSGGVRAVWQRGDWTVGGRGSFRFTDVETNGYDLRQNLLTDPAFLRQDMRSDHSGLGGDADVQLRFEPGARLRLYARGRIGRTGNESGGLTTTTHLDDAESPILRYDRDSDTESRGVSGSFSTGLQYRWEPRRHELEIDFTVQDGRTTEDGREQITTDSVGDGPLIPAELTLDNQDDRSRGGRLEVDYTHPWGEAGRVEMGYQLDVNDSDADRVISFVDAGPDAVVSDRGYAHRQVVHGGYLTIGRQLATIGLQLGLRAEQTDSRLDIPTGDRFRDRYTNLFPSASVSYRPSRAVQLRVSYSLRTQRPSASVLNPVDRSTDPLSRRVGNPDIEPAFTHSISMNAGWNGVKGGLRLSPYYRRTLNDWAETMAVDSDGVSIRTYHNVASQVRYGATLTYSLRPIEGWNGFISVGANRLIRDASNLSDRYSGSSFRWSSRARVQAQISSAFSWESSLSYSPPVDLPQGRSDARYAADFGFRYRFLEERASLRLTLRDPFQLRRSGIQTRDVSYIQIGQSRETTRSAAISLSYTFGGGGSYRGRRGR
jgi:hypothetical protein